MSDTVEELPERLDSLEFNTNDELPNRSDIVDEFLKRFDAAEELPNGFDSKLMQLGCKRRAPNHENI
jgi:hypothetical protein